ncbi:MAG: PqqD family protein [Gallicola sp.]|nr:PqqD family protein [Gallicola sp.]
MPETLHPSKEEKGLVIVLVENKGIFNRFGQKFLKKPVQSKIQLDPLGSFIWKQIDGKATIYEIGQKVEEQFGEKADPLYPRLTEFIKTLQKVHYIDLK